MDVNNRLMDLMSAANGLQSHGLDSSRATSPGAPDWRDATDQTRVRPRTFPYSKYLPYDVESEAERLRNLDEIVNHLYVAVEAGDFAPGAVHWTRELRSWLGLKFDPSRSMRVKLVKLYYELALAPGIDPSVAERFASMFMVLTK